MPGFDGTGPRGMGPMTGGRRGFCSPWGLGTMYGRGGGMPYPMATPYRMPYPYPYGGMPYSGAPAYARLKISKGVDDEDHHISRRA